MIDAKSQKITLKRNIKWKNFKRRKKRRVRNLVLMVIYYLEWDLIMNKIEELNVNDEQAGQIKKAILHKEGEMLREK